MISETSLRLSPRAQLLAEPGSQDGAVVGIEETHLYECLVVAEEIADVESVLSLSQANAQDLVALSKEQLEGIGEPDLPSDPGLRASDGVEDDGFEDNISICLGSNFFSLPLFECLEPVSKYSFLKEM